MKRVITYGSFDLFHYGHSSLLKRAKELGDYLIVGVTTETFDRSRGKLNIQDSLTTRIENVKNTGFADEIILEEHEGQKVTDIQKYEIDVFAVGSDWVGKFDYLGKYCEVVYLERTRGISSTDLRNERSNILGFGIMGCGSIADGFVPESRFVSGLNVEAVFDTRIDRAEHFAQRHQLQTSTSELGTFLDGVDAVYVASPHSTHYQYVRSALEAGKHVLCESPLVLSAQEAAELFGLSRKNNLLLLEVIRTAFAPAFENLMGVANSGQIGSIKIVDATLTRSTESQANMLGSEEDGLAGSVTDLASYPLMAIVKLLGTDIREMQCYSCFAPNSAFDILTRIHLVFDDAIASATVGLGVESEDSLTISGTEGYIHVPAPWWKTESFESRVGHPARSKKHFLKLEGDGLRYEIAEFVSTVAKGKLSTYKLRDTESTTIAGVIEKFTLGKIDGKGITRVT